MRTAHKRASCLPQVVPQEPPQLTKTWKLSAGMEVHQEHRSMLYPLLSDKRGNARGIWRPWIIDHVILSEGIDPVDCLASPSRISFHRSFGQSWGLALSKRTLVHFSMLVSGLDQRSPFFNRLGTDLSVNANKVLKGLDFYNLYLRIFRNPPEAIFETGAAFTSNTLGMTKYGTCSQDSDVINAVVRWKRLHVRPRLMDLN